MIFLKPLFTILLFVSLIFSSIITKSQGSWEQLNTPVNNDFLDLYFIDSLTGWVVGDSGLIIHTKDGGLNWEMQESHVTNDIVSVFFFDNVRGWASAINYSTLPYGSIILKTVDGGQNWIATPYNTSSVFINSIMFLDTLRGWMVGTPHLFMSTVDGGISWHQANIDTSTLAFFPVLNIKFYNDQYGYASGGIFDIAGVIWHTNNGGNNWVAISTDDAPADEVHGLHLFDSVNVIGSGGDPDFGYGVGMMHTSNGGSSWDYDEIGVQGIAYDIDFVNNLEGWAALGAERKFVYSTDGGLTWLESNTPNAVAIYKLDFSDSIHGYAVGSNGAFLRYKPTPPVNVESIIDSREFPEISQNFPNPFRYHTTITISNLQSISSNNHMKLLLFDVTGKKVRSFIPIEISNCKYNVEINGEDLGSGIYYYHLQQGTQYSPIMRMVLIK
jgi:photosystem II stability/assembly factor-like uncharacterized protein